MRRIVIGVMGGGSVSAADAADAYELGRQIALQGWVLLTGGRQAGIMEAASKGAAEHGGTTVGILPNDSEEDLSPHVHIPILTGMGSGRNIINVLTSQAVVACPGGAGTLSEVALALKHGRPVVLLNVETGKVFERYQAGGQLHRAASPEQAMASIRSFVERLDAGR